MEYSAVLCVCSAATPFVATMREICLNRRPWFTFVLLVAATTFAVLVCTAFIYMKAADQTCYNYQDVVNRLWQCSAEQEYDDTCCREVEGDVSQDCGWTTSRAEFCTQFGDYTLDYCGYNYCPYMLNGTAPLQPSETSSSES